MEALGVEEDLDIEAERDFEAMEEAESLEEVEREDDNLWEEWEELWHSGVTGTMSLEGDGTRAKDTDFLVEISSEQSWKSSSLVGETKT